MKPYKVLFLVLIIHFFIMYLLVFASVNTWSDIRLFNMRNFYMAFIMVSPMIMLMIFFMKEMYKNERLNSFLYFSSFIIFILGLVFIQKQAFVGDKQLAQSMIPHHSGAITMCQEAVLTDNELRQLCDEIIKSQREEINQMKKILQRL
ncbi:MAG: hypothetical protein UR60_C0006G0005 [Candidatus Moranbacteria bacterium GW2011_GWF2_34_56]|nr:MAG: hypothetical protein UR51_C0005G0012 [Candidatus Moranbacteria bacterium GW2011_GWF1_34_10]KKP65183.1 MAG: hypothetical protein UR60_C0006G0005 [Candidatus Moranbacteria bacterium GW2011_GWF2_34_56]HBI16726.1 DUF305 domain-containing protein [Candidatus Moranbacteria bacterium]